MPICGQAISVRLLHFAGNVSNVTYTMNAGWNDNCWDYAYRNVMVEA